MLQDNTYLTLKRTFNQIINIVSIGIVSILLCTYIGLYLLSDKSQNISSDIFTQLLISPMLYFFIVSVIVFVIFIKFQVNKKLNIQLASIEQLEYWAETFNNQNKTELIAASNNPIVTAINRLQQQLVQAQNHEIQIEQRIRQQVLLDDETGIGNREFLNNRLEVLLLENHRGALLLIQGCDDLLHQTDTNQAINLLNNIIPLIKKRLHHLSSYFIARVGECEIAILLPGLYVDETKKLADKMITALLTLDLPRSINKDGFMHIGISCFTCEKQSFQILSEADMALRSAQLQGPTQWFMFAPDEVAKVSAKGSLRWRTFLTLAIKNNDFIIYFQPVIASFDKKIIHYEILSKVKGEQGKLINARVFLPMAKKCGLSKDIDMLVFQQLCQMLQKTPRKQIKYSLNFSVETLLSPNFLVDFMIISKLYPAIVHQLIIEVSEYHLTSNITALTIVLEQLNNKGIHLLVDKVGQFGVSSNYLTLCPISYLKLHRSIVLNIDEKLENQIFVRSLELICEENNIDIYALGVESFNEWQTLIKLGVNGGQGHYFTVPVANVV